MRNKIKKIFRKVCTKHGLDHVKFDHPVINKIAPTIYEVKDLLNHDHLLYDEQLFLSQSPLESAKIALAQKEYLFPDVQSKLAESTVKVRKALALNPHLLPDIEVLLSEDARIHEQIIQRSNLSPLTLLNLQDSPLPEVREYVVCHPSTSLSFVEEAVQGGDSYLYEAALNSGKTQDFSEKTVTQLISAMSPVNSLYLRALEPYFLKNIEAAKEYVSFPCENVRIATFKALIQCCPEVLLESLDNKTTINEATKLTSLLSQTALERSLEVSFLDKIAEIAKKNSHEKNKIRDILIDVSPKLNENHIDTFVCIGESLYLERNLLLNGPNLRTTFDQILRCQQKAVLDNDSLFLSVVLARIKDALGHPNCPPDLIRSFRKQQPQLLVHLFKDCAPQRAPQDVVDFLEQNKLTKAEDLEKMSRPQITFPKILPKDTRPETQVQQVSTPRQREMFTRRSTTNMLHEMRPNMDKDIKRIATADYNRQIGKLTSDPNKIGGAMSGRRDNFETKPNLYTTTKDPQRQDITEVHEGFHGLLTNIANKYGRDHRHATVNHLLSHFEPEAVSFLKDLTSKSYKPEADGFNEEMLIAARDMNMPGHRKNSAERTFMSGKYGTDYNKITTQVKRGWQRAYEAAKQLTPEKLKELVSNKA